MHYFLCEHIEITSLVSLDQAPTSSRKLQTRSERLEMSVKHSRIIACWRSTGCTAKYVCDLRGETRESTGRRNTTVVCVSACTHHSPGMQQGRSGGNSGWGRAARHCDALGIEEETRTNQVLVKLGKARFAMIVDDKNSLDHRCSLCTTPHAPHAAATSCPLRSSWHVSVDHDSGFLCPLLALLLTAITATCGPTSFHTGSECGD